MKSGFSMTTEEFFKTTLFHVLEKYRIVEKLTVSEYYELLRQLIDICSENDFRKLGLCWNDVDDLKEK